MLSIRGQFEEKLHHSMISFGFKGGLVAPYKCKFYLNDISVIFEGKYYNSLYILYKDTKYEFNSINELFNHKLIKTQIRKQKLKNIIG